MQCVRAYDSFNVNRRRHGLMRPLYFLRSNFYHPCERYKKATLATKGHTKNASPAQRGPRRALQRLRVAGVAVLL